VSVQRQVPKPAEVFEYLQLRRPELNRKKARLEAALAITQEARFTLIGRGYLHGLLAGGGEGVDRAIAILADQIIHTMKLLGDHTPSELEPAHVTQLERLALGGRP
jgi:hypothetical protein